MTISFKKIQKIKRNILQDLSERISEQFCNELLEQLTELDEAKSGSPCQERLARIREKDIVDSYVTAAKIVASAIEEIGEEYGV